MDVFNNVFKVLSDALKLVSYELTYLKHVLFVRSDRKIVDFSVSMFEVGVSTISFAEIFAKAVLVAGLKGWLMKIPGSK